MIQEAIIARLSSQSGLTNLIGTSPMRVFPRLLPQGPIYPAITFMKVSETREPAMGLDAGLVHSRWQFDVWDFDVRSVREVTEQLRLALERYRGTFLDANSVTRQWFDTFIDNVQEPGPELVDAAPVFHTITDVMIHYSE